MSALQAAFATVAASIDQATTGTVRLIAIGSPQRLGGSLANTPTLREQGIDVTKANWRAALEKKFWTDSFMVGRELSAFLQSG